MPFGAHRNGDSKPSASLNYKKLAFHCLGCGAKGGLLWFIAVCRGDDDGHSARQWLGEQTGFGGTVMEGHKLVQILEAIFAQQNERPEAMPVYPKVTLDPWTHDGVHPYMTHVGSFGPIKCRGIPEENCKRFGVGYAEAYPMGYVLHPDGTKTWREPQERIVIPIFWDGKLVGWQARAIDPADEPKYKNSAEFPRDRVLYGWEPGMDIVLVESPMSVLRHCHHQPMVASLGKELTDIQLRILQRAKSITMWFDPDRAGWSGTERAIEELKRYVPMKVAVWPYGYTDPADLDDDTVDRVVAEAVPWSIWRRPEQLLDWRG
jgi:DNA primase